MRFQMPTCFGVHLDFPHSLSSSRSAACVATILYARPRGNPGGTSEALGVQKGVTLSNARWRSRGFGACQVRGGRLLGALRWCSEEGPWAQRSVTPTDHRHPGQWPRKQPRARPQAPRAACSPRKPSETSGPMRCRGSGEPSALLLATTPVSPRHIVFFPWRPLLCRLCRPPMPPLPRGSTRSKVVMDRPRERGCQTDTRGRGERPPAFALLANASRLKLPPCTHTHTPACNAVSCKLHHATPLRKAATAGHLARNLHGRQLQRTIYVADACNNWAATACIRRLPSVGRQPCQLPHRRSTVCAANQLLLRVPRWRR